MLFSSLTMVNNNLFVYSLFRPPDASASWAALDPQGEKKKHSLKEEGMEEGKTEGRRGRIFVGTEADESQALIPGSSQSDLGERDMVGWVPTIQGA